MCMYVKTYTEHRLNYLNSCDMTKKIIFSPSNKSNSSGMMKTLSHNIIGENFVGENFRHLANILSLLQDETFCLCFRSLLLEFKNLRLKIDIFNLIMISYNQNIIFSQQQLSCCVVL